MLRQLRTGEEVDTLDLLFSESRTASGRPWVMLNMVESVDGATAVDGGASALNDADDRALFLALRAVADVVLNGAETVRKENLGPVRLDDQMRQHRLEAGIEGDPKMVILTRSLNIEPGHRVFSQPENRAMIITGKEAPAERAEALSQVADVVRIERLDGRGIVGALEDAKVILCEGGPTINSQLIAAGVVDEVNLTVSPLLALGESKRVASGPPPDSPFPMRIDRTLIGERSLFLRFVRA